MIRRQRKIHAQVWTALAILLPVALLGVLALAPDPAQDWSPIRLEPPKPQTGGGG